MRGAAVTLTYGSSIVELIRGFDLFGKTFNGAKKSSRGKPMLHVAGIVTANDQSQFEQCKPNEQINSLQRFYDEHGWPPIAGPVDAPARPLR